MRGRGRDNPRRRVGQLFRRARGEHRQSPGRSVVLCFRGNRLQSPSCEDSVRSLSVERRFAPFVTTRRRGRLEPRSSVARFTRSLRCLRRAPSPSRLPLRVPPRTAPRLTPPQPRRSSSASLRTTDSLARADSRPPEAAAARRHAPPRLTQLSRLIVETGALNVYALGDTVLP